MLYARFHRVRPERLELLRSWLQEIQRRRAEAIASYEQEGTRHVQVYLLDGAGGPVLAFLAEVGDPDEAKAVNVDSDLAIDLEHREVMHAVVEGPADAELLYECVAPARSGGRAT